MLEESGFTSFVLGYKIYRHLPSISLVLKKSKVTRAYSSWEEVFARAEEKF